MSRDSVVTRTEGIGESPRGRSLVSLAPYSAMRGDTIMNAPTEFEPVSADHWWQSPNMDPYLTVPDPHTYTAVPDTGYHEYVVLAACDLLITMSVEIAMPVDADPNFGFYAGFRLVGAYDATFDDGTGPGQDEKYMLGPFTRAAFSSVALSDAGLSMTRSVHINSGLVSIRPIIGVFSISEPGEKLSWKITVVLLEPATPRVLPFPPPT